jgi:hypothetical protein
MDTPFSPFHWLVVLIIVGLLIPIQRILRRAGFSGWWCLLFFIPIANFVGLWMLAFKRWPTVVKAVGGADDLGVEKRMDILLQQLSELQTALQKPGIKTEL